MLFFSFHLHILLYVIALVDLVITVWCWYTGDGFRDGPNLRKVMADPPYSALTGTLDSFNASRRKILAQLTDALDRRFADEGGLLKACRLMNLALWPIDLKDDPGIWFINVKEQWSFSYYYSKYSTIAPVSQVMM